MIFRRYLLRELLSTWLLWSVSLVLVLLSVVAAKTFKQIDIQALDLVTWIQLFLINGLRYFPHLIAIATYLAVFNTSTRYWGEGEIWVWRNAGVTARVLLQQLALYILPMSLAMALFSGWIVPWSYQQGALQQLAIARTPLTRFSGTGQFLRFPAGLTIRIEGKNQNGRSTKDEASSVFVFRETGLGIQTQHASIWAKSAQLDPLDNRVILTLKEGTLKQYRALDTAPKIDMRFSSLRYFFSLPNPDLDDNPKWMAWSRLWSVTSASGSVIRNLIAERYWRVSFPFHVLIISWMAWCLGRHNTRAGQSAHLLSLILLDQLYLNLINLLQNSIEKGNLYGWELFAGCLLHVIFISSAWIMWHRQSR